MQNKVLPIALNELSSVLGTKVTAEEIDIDFFEEITLNNILIEGSQGDTLVSAEFLNIDMSIFSFFNKTLFIDDIKLSGAKINLADANGESNYQHILDHLSNNAASNDSDPNIGSDSWNFGLDDIYLNDIVIRQEGITSTMEIVIPNFEADFSEFPSDFDTISFNEIISEGLSFSLVEHKPSESKSSATAFPILPFVLKAKKMKVESTRIVYDKSYKERVEGVFDPNHINLSNLELISEDIEWGDEFAGKIKSLSFENHNEWKLINFKSKLFANRNRLMIDGLVLETSDSKIIGTVKGEYKDFNSLIQDLMDQNMEASLQSSVIGKNDITYFLGNAGLSSIDLNYLEDINYSGGAKIREGSLNLKNIELRIGNKLSLRGGVMLGLQNSNRFDVNLNNIRTSQTYLTNLLPSLVLPTEVKDLGEIVGDIALSGDHQEVAISKMNLTLRDDTVLNARGVISRLDQAPDIWLDLQFDKLYFNASDLLQGESIPSQVYNMGQIDFSGSYTGSLEDISINGQLMTDIGSADVDASVQFSSDYSDGKYNGDFDFRSFDLGALLQDSTFGIIIASGTIDGEGFDPNTLVANMDVRSKVFEYQGETYEDIDITGKYNKGEFKGRFVSEDDDLQLDFDGVAHLNGEESKLGFSSNIERLDLTQFGIGDSIFWISGLLKGDFIGNNIDNINGTGIIKNLKIGTENGIYEADTDVKIRAIELNGNKKEYGIESPFLDGAVEGNIKLSELPLIIEAYIKNYIPIAYGYKESVVVDSTIFDDQNFAIDLITKDLNPLLSVLLEAELSVKNGFIKGNFSSENSQIDFKGSIDSLVYDGYVIENGGYFFDGRQDFINGNIILDNISDGKETLIYEANINISFSNKVATITAELFDEDDEQILLIGSDISRREDYIVNFHDTLIINQSIWEFSPFNEITYGEYGLYMQDVSVAKGIQHVTAYTDENENGQAIEVLMDNFILSELTSIIGKENDYFEGEINGFAVINNIWGKPFITANVEMKDIMLRDYGVGVAKVIAVQDAIANTVVTEIDLKGEENDATVDIIYSIKTRAIKGLLDMKRLEIKTIDPFLTEILSDSEGALAGKIKISGTPTEPLINGELDLVGVQTTPVFTNSRYAILDQKIIVDEESIDFGNMIVVDMDNNIANITGQVLHTNLSEFYLDMNIDTDKFLFLNTTAADNELFYGDVTVEADVSILGPMDDIKIDGTATAIDNSKLAISPFSAEELDYENDFIIYVDPRKISLDSLKAKSQVSGDTYPFDVDLTLSIEEDSEFEMIMNPITGDNITARGTANLILNLSKSGEMNLFGTYEVASGMYLFTFGPISKEFEIQKGGTLVFNGDPLQGVLDVEAVYEANTSVYDLLFLEVPDDFDDSEIAETKRRRPVNVVLSLSNSLLKPEIAMNIKQLEQSISGNTEIYELVDERLEILRNDPNELNKQVFGLMILDNFIVSSGSDPNFAQTGANIAFSSLSSLVTSQLNSLADGLVKGVDLNFDVNSYSSDFISSGQAGLVTELGVGVSKKLFNDRLTLSAGTAVDLESSTSSALFNNLAGDFIIAYQATEDGKVNIKVFRKSNYTTIGDENASKNGVGINYRKEFGTIKKKSKN